MDLYDHFGSLEAVFQADFRDLIHVPRIHETLARRVLTPPDDDGIQHQITLMEKSSVALVPIWSDEYPQLLKHIYDPPLALFCRGKLDALNRQGLAMVGTRKPTAAGKAGAEMLSRGLVENEFTVVSGGARGIDTIAHRTALKHGGSTIAVLGCGVDRAYPAENRQLFESIMDNGCIVSEFLMGTKPDAPNFPRRNRLISGMTHGTLVVEAAQKSGSLITAYYALDQNREVFAVPGSITSPQSAGTNALLQQGAKLVVKVQDILDELNVEPHRKPAKQMTLTLSLKPSQEAIVQLLQDGAMHIDELSDELKLPSFSLMSDLLEMEIEGLVKQSPGKYFSLPNS